MGLCQPSKNYTVNLKTYSGGGSISKTIAECVNLIKGVNSSYDFIFLDPYNYPYIIGGYTLPANTTDLYFVTDAKYTSYTNMIGVRGESNGTAISVLYTQLSMYCIYNDGTRLIGAGVGHNFSSTTLDGNTYRTASGSYEYPYIFYCDRDDVNIYINDELQYNWENIIVNLKHNITQATILDMSAATANQECNYDTNTLFTPGTDFRDFAISGTEYNQDMTFDDDELMLYQNNSTNSYIQCYSYYHSSSDNGGGWKIYYQGESIGGYTSGIFGKYDKYFGVAFLIDEENQVGQIVECYSYYPNTSWSRKHYTRRLITNSNMLHKAYLLIKEIITGAKVKVSYYLPDDTYTYSKLTYNSEHEPEDKDDGTSIDILPSNTSVNVEGLEEDTLYYFTIFTNKSESEPFPFVVGDIPVPPGPTPPEPSVERKDLIYCNWGSGNVTFRATIGQQYSFRYNNVDYNDCYYPFAFWAGQGDMRVVGGDLDNYGTSYIYYNCASYSGSASTVQQLDNACPIFDSFNADCLTWARRGYL